MPLTKVRSKWVGGDLIFHDKTDESSSGYVLRIAENEIEIYVSTAITGTVSLEGDLTLSTADVSVVQGRFVYLEGQDSTTYITAAAAGYLDLEAATAIRPGIDLLTDRWRASSTHTLIGMGVAGAGNLTAGNTNCTGFGYNALNAVTSGDHNSAFGASAMALNTTGVSNVAVGRSALAANTSGHYGTAVGSQALQTNTTGTGNTAVGFSALLVNTTGGGNTAVGYEALVANTTGGETNTAVGYYALHANTTGDHNVAVGHSALLLNTTGVGNIAIGQTAGDNITSADYCIIIGYAVDAPSATTDAQLKIGATTAAMGYLLGDNAGDMTINAVTGKLIQLAIAGTDEVNVSAASLYPATDDGCILGILNTNEWSDLFLASGGVIGWSNNDVTLTHAANLLTMAGGNLRMGTTDRIEFRDADVHIYSRSDGRMTIGADTYLEVNAYTVVNNYLKLWNTDTDSGNLQGSLWMDTSDQTIKYRRWISGATFATRTLVNLEEAQTFTGVITVSSDNKLYFRDAAIYIWSGSDGNLNLVADTYVVIDGYTVVNNYLKLWNTDTDAGNLQGSIWQDTSDQTIKYRRFTAPNHWYTRTIANLEEEQTFVEHLNITGDKKLKFRDAGVFIHSNADGQLKLSADIGGATHNAITLAGNTRCTGYFCLHSTATPATDTAGQMWFDTDDQKIHFRDYTGERIVTSTAAV